MRSNPQTGETNKKLLVDLTEETKKNYQSSCGIYPARCIFYSVLYTHSSISNPLFTNFKCTLFEVNKFLYADLHSKRCDYMEVLSGLGFHGLSNDQ